MSSCLIYKQFLSDNSRLCTEMKDRVVLILYYDYSQLARGNVIRRNICYQVCEAIKPSINKRLLTGLEPSGKTSVLSSHQFR